MKAIKAIQLTVNYGECCVLFDVSFDVERGSITGIVGPNGAGKSTLLKSLIRLIKPLSGDVTFLDMPLSQVRKRVAYVPQRGQIDWDFPITAFDVALMGRYHDLGFLKWARKADKHAALDMLDKLGMLAFKDRQISDLSGGQQQRLFIARALLQEADVYLLDEPFAGIDHSTEELIIGMLKKQRDAGKTVLMVHHDLSSVEKYFDDLILLNTSLVATGPVAEVFNPDNLSQTYGRDASLFTDAIKLSQEKASGIK
ncbi:MAG: Manganese transport system ATP-binding protein MntB [Chlamydiia bacterium]|nr:Manganese transport system ATP-binding protein MntB [Chlamydiia bacterium]MCH9616135.1 Manganese transport system ATP-binding protein MntB [Chlamydiia bacterium]MCH9629442.1 Manganese transport system ATP-binding protein MntB [Chlamydiia bacterium]